MAAEGVADAHDAGFEASQLLLMAAEGVADAHDTGLVGRRRMADAALMLMRCS